jgi:hypothetical protein
MDASCKVYWPRLLAGREGGGSSLLFLLGMEPLFCRHPLSLPHFTHAGDQRGDEGCAWGATMSGAETQGRRAGLFRERGFNHTGGYTRFQPKRVTRIYWTPTAITAGLAACSFRGVTPRLGGATGAHLAPCVRSRVSGGRGRGFVEGHVRRKTGPAGA